MCELQMYTAPAVHHPVLDSTSYFLTRTNFGYHLIDSIRVVSGTNAPSIFITQYLFYPALWSVLKNNSLNSASLDPGFTILSPRTFRKIVRLLSLNGLMGLPSCVSGLEERHPELLVAYLVFPPAIDR